MGLNEPSHLFIVFSYYPRKSVRLSLLHKSVLADLLLCLLLEYVKIHPDYWFVKLYFKISLSGKITEVALILEVFSSFYFIKLSYQGCIAFTETICLCCNICFSVTMSCQQWTWGINGTTSLQYTYSGSATVQAQKRKYMNNSVDGPF